MPEVLYAPSREQVITTNAWAFLHWLRTTRALDLPDWAGLQAWSVKQPLAFQEAMETFGHACETPSALAGGGWGEADILLFADLRPGDKLLVISSGTADPFGQAAEASASVLVAPALLIADAAFRRPHRHALAELRIIIATGGPMSPEARRRIYAWGKSGVMLLARSGDTYWGNPLEPVLGRPPAAPAFAKRSPSVRMKC